MTDKKAEPKKLQKDANKTGFHVGLIYSCKGNFETFKTWYDPMYKDKTADAVWKELQTEKAEIEKRKKAKV